MEVQPFGLHLACNCGTVSPVVFYHKAMPDDVLPGISDIFDTLDSILERDTPKPTFLSYSGYVKCSGCGNVNPVLR